MSKANKICVLNGAGRLGSQIIQSLLKIKTENPSQKQLEISTFVTPDRADSFKQQIWSNRLDNVMVERTDKMDVKTMVSLTNLSCLS